MQLNFETERIIQAHPAVRDLISVLSRPVLLSPGTTLSAEELVSDARLQNWLKTYQSVLETLLSRPDPLVHELASKPHYGRLGRYFEHLLHFWLTTIVKAPRLKTNLAIQENKRTLGELDLLFQETESAPLEHWEVSVKFYICVGQNEAERRQARFFIGTLVEDRLDHKLRKLFTEQLPRARWPAARQELEKLGLEAPHSRVLMKGLFFYSSEEPWQEGPHPEEVSSQHDRGWWTTSSLLNLPQQDPGHFWMPLGILEWLSPFLGKVPASRLRTRKQILEDICKHFDLPPEAVTPEVLRRLEMTVAEAKLLEPTEAPFRASEQGFVTVQEVSRGHIVHHRWPELARESILATSKV